LAARKNTQLVDRRQRCRADEVALHAALLELASQPFAALVFTDDGRQNAARAERCHVQRNVGGAAGALLGRAGANDGDRSFGRYSRRVAEPILVEHGVPGDEHAEVSEVWDRQRHRRSPPLAINGGILREKGSAPISQRADQRRTGTTLETVTPLPAGAPW
jgi:hypothetical protein